MPSAKTVIGGDHGLAPLLPTAKQVRIASPAKLLPQKTPNSTPLHKGRCCNCTSKSTCQQSCECRKSKQPCRNCDYFGQCRNKQDYKAALCRSTQDTLPGTDESPGPVVILTNVAPQSTQTDDKPTKPAQPRHLILEEPPKGSPPPSTNRTKKSIKAKDKHQD